MVEATLFGLAGGGAARGDDGGGREQEPPGEQGAAVGGGGGPAHRHLGVGGTGGETQPGGGRGLGVNSLYNHYVRLCILIGQASN